MRDVMLEMLETHEMLDERYHGSDAREQPCACDDRCLFGTASSVNSMPAPLLQKTSIYCVEDSRREICCRRRRRNRDSSAAMLEANCTLGP